MSGKPPAARVAFRLFRLLWPFWQFCAVTHFRRFAVAIIRALSTAGAAHPAVRFTARLSARAAGAAAHTGGGSAGLGCGGHAADAVTLAAAYIGRGVEQIPRPAVDGLPCCVHQRKAVAFGTGAAASSRLLSFIKPPISIIGRKQGKRKIGGSL